MKKIIALIVVCAMLVGTLLLSATTALASVGGSAADPHVVGSPAEVPATAVEDNPSTYNTAAACDTTRSWVDTKPGTTAVTHKEWTAESRTRTYTPGKAEVKEYRFPKETRVWVPEVKEVKVYSYEKVTTAVKEVKEYTFDKYVQKQKARWDGNRYVGPISAGYSGSYGWRDAGFAPVTNRTGVTPTAPGPSRGAFIHNSNGAWYWTLFYEYRKISERVVTVGQPEKVEYSGEVTSPLGSPWVLLSGYPKVKTAGVPAHWGPWTPAGYTAWSTVPNKPAATDTTRYGVTQVRTVTSAVPESYGPWSAWTAYGNNPYLSDPVLPANTATKEYRKFGPVVVTDVEATTPVVTYYAWTDGKECEVVTPPPTPTPPVTTPTPEPPVALPPETGPPSVITRKPAAKIRSACTGKVGYSFNNTKSSVAVTFKFLHNGKVKKNVVPAGKSEFKVKKAKAYSLAWIKAKGVSKVKTRVPGSCSVPRSGK